MKPVAVVTGGNRGIGQEICRQLAQKGMEVILTARQPEPGQQAAAQLQQEGLAVQFFPLEVTEANAREKLAAHLKERFGKIAVLVNNAAIMPEKQAEQAGNPRNSLVPNEAELLSSFQVNTLAPYQLSTSLWPLLVTARGRIINMSSGMGQLHGMGTGFVAYRVSKTALNAITSILATEGRKAGVSVNSVCPGWVQTSMGGQEAPRSVAEGADTVTWLATEAPAEFTGRFFRNRKEISW